ncbi:MAG: 50S ribosomal protein L13 [Actinobacteria bacterium]|nr:50S ribosomal protein L13 [Actinomycetota bacterium]
MATYQPKASEIERAWHVIDARGRVLGRLASEVAQLLRGKHKPIWAPHVDCGDHVVIVNAGEVEVTGSKRTEKRYWRHSGFPGGIRSRSFEEMIERHPDRVVRLAVRGMLPKNRLGRRMLGKLHVYAGPNHPHQAQKPQPYELVARRSS